ncbi:MAG TPA: circularly permuted type 2 ATP-grasp protein, partial [Mucilaginibacter sp.]
LVFGQDLTVSDGYVWLKTLRGLEKVDVIVRRVDDIFCDPLEFLGDSHLGVVGLMEAVRQKKVTIINPLGCRILESPALMAFLPRLCRHLLKEELILPSVATWWCGHEKEKKYVLDNLPFLIIRSIYRSNENLPYIGSELSKKQIDDLRAEINTRPHLYVAQEVVSFSTTPSLIENSLEACNAVFRSYLVADMEKQVYHVMPGGLSRSFPTKGEFMISNQSGGISKDTWVLGPSPESAVATSINQPILRQVKNILPSRTGESLFWLGRYLDRSISNVRMMRIVLKIYNERDDEVHPEASQTLVVLLKSLSALTGTLPGFAAPDQSKLRQPEKELLSLAVETGRAGTLAQSLQSFLTNGHAVRDRLSLDTWRILDSISEEFDLMKENGNDLRKIYHHLDQFIIKLMAFIGLNNDNMTRASSWRLLNIGRFLESSVNTCTILQAALANYAQPDVEKHLMELVLMCHESLVTYRYLYRSTLQLPGVLNLLIVNEDNPKSVAFLIAKVDEHLAHLPESDQDGGLSPARKKLLEALTVIRLCDVTQMVSPGEANNFTHKELSLFLHKLITILGQASTMIFESYFSPTQSQYSFVKSNNLLPEL